MDFPEPQRANNSSLEETDMLSSLLENLKVKIINYLPIRESGRTSILSSKWRYTWTSIPKLVFTDRTKTPNLIEFVDTIFLLHNGPIHKFFLITTQDCCKAFDRWIVNLSRNGIRKLIFCVCRNEYVMHFKFFSCEELQGILLNNCSFKLPLYFKGFKRLRTLTLKDSNVSACDIEKLISSCPLLKGLALMCLRESVVLNIHAPNLQSLDIMTKFLDLQVRSPNLLSLCIYPETPPTNKPYSRMFEQVLGNVSALKDLELSSYFLQYLCDEPFGEGLSLNFNRLENLDVILDFMEEKEASFALAMFQRAPHLKSLVVTLCLREGITTFPIAKIWKKVNRRENLFKHLQTAKINGFRAVDSMFSFVEFILDSAPQLVTLTIQKHQKDQQDEGMMLKQLLHFKRASPNARIIFK